ncbi:MAG: TonB C-terminal domain-containing protein [Pseudomonadota bacterium]
MLNHNLKAAVCVATSLLVLPASPAFAQDDGYERTVSVGARYYSLAPNAIRLPEPIELENWASPADFPALAQPLPLRVSVNLTLSISADGAVEACRAGKRGPVFGANRHAMSPQDWVAASCKIIMDHARFIPAIDSEGDRIGVEFDMGVRYDMYKAGLATETLPTIPPPAPPPSPRLGPSKSRRAAPTKELGIVFDDPGIQSSLVEAIIDIDATGVVRKCRIRGSSGSDKADAAVCKHLRKTKFTPRLDYEGRPGPDVYYIAKVPIRKP